jgi:hypothetical protein
MAPGESVEARPRRTVEMIDDAWRIFFAEPWFLLALTVLFYFPAVMLIILLTASSPPETAAGRLLLAALAVFSLLLTGLSAGACQEAFYSWAEGYDVRLGECLKAARSREWYVVASQSLALLGPVGMLTSLLSPWLPTAPRIVFGSAFCLFTVLITMAGLTWQPSFAAGKPRFWRALRYGTRAFREDFGRALLLVGLRGLILLFAVVNLHLFATFALWAAEQLAGLDVAYISVLCSLSNGAYSLALILLTWVLLRPFTEATNYLFFMDMRTRFEGLDLWNRVQDLFVVEQPVVTPVVNRTNKAKTNGNPAALHIFLVVSAVPLLAAAAVAQEARAAIQAARQEIQAIRDEVEQADPYPGGQSWKGRLEAVNALLTNSAKPDSFRWFQTAVQDFPGLKQRQALQLLDDLDARLALMLDLESRKRQAGEVEGLSADRIKSLVPPEKRTGAKRKRQVDEAKDEPKDEPPKNKQDVEPERARRAGPSLVAPAAVGGAANVLLIFLVGLGAAVLVATIIAILCRLWREKPKTAPRQAGVLAPPTDELLLDPDKQSALQLWHQADEQAQRGDHLGAIRTLYLAVLTLLHQCGCIRYQRTRTNGEYVDQLRPRTALQQPFLGLTSVFEVKWYGERACESEDYRNCRELAEDIRLKSLQGTA